MRQQAMMTAKHGLLLYLEFVDQNVQYTGNLTFKAFCIYNRIEI